MAMSRQQQAPPPSAYQQEGKRIRAAAAALPGSPLPGYGLNGGRLLRHCHHRQLPFRLPSLNASPTCSVDDLSNEDPPVPPLYSQQQQQQRRSDSPGSYKKTLEQLAALRKQRPMLGSTSDYFSLTSSVCSDDGDPASYCSFDDEDQSIQSEYGWPLSPQDIDELRSVAERVLQGHACGDEVRIKADLLDNICQQTRELERRNEELRQELEQLHFDTKRFVEKNATTKIETGGQVDNGQQQWTGQDFGIVFDDNETTI